MPRFSSTPPRILSSTGLVNAADAAGYAVAGFQDVEDTGRGKRGGPAMRFAVVFVPLILAIIALAAVGYNI